MPSFIIINSVTSGIVENECFTLCLRLVIIFLVSRLPSGPNAEHRQLQIDIKDSPVRGAAGHVAH